MRPSTLTLWVLLPALAACDRPTAPEIVEAIYRHEADPLAGATEAYYGARFGFNVMRSSMGIEPAELLVEIDGRLEAWEAIVVERRFVRDSVPGRPCGDVSWFLVAIRDEERAVIEISGEDFSQRLQRWEWCGNPGSEGYGAPHLAVTWKTNEIVVARDGEARLESVGPAGSGCVFRHDRYSGERYRVDCERSEVRVAATASLEPVRSRTRAQSLRIEPQLIPGVRLTIHCGTGETEHLAGCMPPPRP